jgi:hypothetical protein
MSKETTENFLQVWSEFAWPEPTTASYRLYYNADGTPKCYSMEIMPDKYVEVDANIFALRPWNVRVVDSILIFIQPPVTVQKLQPNKKSGTPGHPKDVCVVVSENQPHTKWNKQTNEIS